MESMEGTQMALSSEVKVANPNTVRSSDFLLRLLAIGTTLVAAVVMGLAKETETIPVVVFPGLAPILVQAPAKMRYSSALVYFVVANAIACAYATLSLLLTIGSRSKPKSFTLVITILDLIMVGLLFSGDGAAATIGVIGYKGNSHVGWNKFCNRFENFCRSLAVSVIVSLIGSLVFVLLVFFSTMNLHQRSR